MNGETNGGRKSQLATVVVTAVYDEYSEYSESDEVELCVHVSCNMYYPLVFVPVYLYYNVLMLYPPLLVHCIGFARFDHY